MALIYKDVQLGITVETSHLTKLMDDISGYDVEIVL